MADLTITVTLSGGETLLSVDAAALVRQVGNKLALAAAQSVIDTATPNVPVDRGLLKSSGHAAPTSDGAVAQYDVPYAADVEKGTPPHDVALEELQGWAQRHGIPAALVRDAIAKRGTRAQPYFDPAVTVVRGQLPDMAADAVNELRTAFTGASQ